MDVLVLYDIHGNIDALEAVLADPSAANPDAVVVGGDTVAGRFAAACLDRLEGLDVPVHWVRGNGEREVAEEVDATDPPAEEDMTRVTAALSAQELGAERSRLLGQQPLTVELDGVLYCHASPRRDDEMLTKLSTPDRWMAALADVATRLVVAGHTHQQFDHLVGDVRYVNAGSVGLPYEGSGDARWLWVTGGDPQLRQTAYDSAAAGRRMLNAGWPDQRSIDASLIDPVDPMVITEIFEGFAAAG